MKTYTNGQRKAMMYGGAAKRKPMMYGGTAKKRKKASAGGMMSASPTQQNTQRKRQQQTAMSPMAPLPMAKGDTPFGMLSVKAGYDNNPKPTAADRIVGAKKN